MPPNKITLRKLSFYVIMFSLTFVFCFTLLEYGFARFYYSNAHEMSDKVFDPVLVEAFASQLMAIANAWRYAGVSVPEEGCENPRERHVF